MSEVCARATAAAPMPLRLYDGAAFDGSGETAFEARAFAMEFLARAGMAGEVSVPAQARGAVQLVVTELVTNAGRHAPGPCVLELKLTGTQLEICVWDTDTALPVAAPPDAERPGQHGLEIVYGLAHSVLAERRAGGKRVRARIDLDPPTD